MNAIQCSTLRLAMAVSFVMAFPAMAQTSPTGERVDQQAGPLERDPAALAALDRMGGALRSARQFTLTSDNSTEIVLENGQKVDLDETVTYKASRPTRLFVEIKSDRKLRELYFDAGKLTLNAPRLKLYASTDVKAA
ncbi:MAG: DUF2092 domain-containing protein, partial [Stenotrophomonas maltophilia]